MTVAGGRARVAEWRGSVATFHRAVPGASADGGDAQGAFDRGDPLREGPRPPATSSMWRSWAVDPEAFPEVSAPRGPAPGAG